MTNMTNTLPLSACNRSQTGSSNILTTGQADMTKNLTFDELMGCTDCLLHVATGHAHEAERLGRDIEANIKQWLVSPQAASHAATATTTTHSPGHAASAAGLGWAARAISYSCAWKGRT